MCLLIAVSKQLHKYLGSRGIIPNILFHCFTQLIEARIALPLQARLSPLNIHAGSVVPYTLSILVFRAVTQVKILDSLVALQASSR
jgi:hypothetical protein